MVSVMRIIRAGICDSRQRNKEIFYRRVALVSSTLVSLPGGVGGVPVLKESLPNHPYRFMHTYTSDSVICFFVVNAGGEIEKDKCATRNRTMAASK